MNWSCPGCSTLLEPADTALHCADCKRDYPIVGGIPDLRVEALPGLDLEQDRRDAIKLADFARDQPVEAVLHRILDTRDWPEERVKRRTRQVLEAPGRLRRELREWLAPALAGSGPFVDLGCGPGMLLAAAALEGHRNIVGIDIALVNLVLADCMVRHHGGEAHLAAAYGEALPLPRRSVTGLVSLDVIEHVSDPGRYLSEIDRVVAQGGHVALSTPNRFSLTAEPHVNVWGVGWLPRSMQKAYAEWRSGTPYESTILLSLPEVRGLMREHTTLDFDVVLAGVSQEELKHYPPHRALAARAYNQIIRTGPIAAVLKPIAPFYRILAERT